MISLFYLATRPWAKEKYEASIFVDVYDASKLLELISYENEKDENWHFYSKKATKKLEEAISHIGSLAYTLKEVNSTLVDKKFIEPLRTLEKNLETRILPRVSEQKDVPIMVSVLHGLAQIFGETVRPLSIDDIVSKNKDLESFTEVRVERKPSQYRLFMSREPVKATGIIALSLLADFLIAYIHSKLFQYDLWTKLSDLTTFVTVLGFGIAIGAIVYEIIKRRT